MQKEKSEPSSAKTGEAEKLREILGKTVQELNELLRLPISLRYEQGFSYPEVAEILGLEENAVRMRVKRGLDALREKLGKYGYAAAPSLIIATLNEGFGIQAPSSLAATLQHIAATGQLPAAKAAAASAKFAAAAGWNLKAKLVIITLLALCAAGTAIKFWPPGHGQIAPKQATASAGVAKSKPTAAPQPASGPWRIIRQWQLPDGFPPARNFCFNGSAIWIGHESLSEIHKLDPIDGRLLETVGINEIYKSGAKIGFMKSYVIIYDSDDVPHFADPETRKIVQPETSSVSLSIQDNKLIQNFPNGKRIPEVIFTFPPELGEGVCGGEIDSACGLLWCCSSKVQRDTIFTINIANGKIVNTWQVPGVHQLNTVVSAGNRQHWIMAEGRKFLLVTDAVENQPVKE